MVCVRWCVSAMVCEERWCGGGGIQNQKQPARPETVRGGVDICESAL